MMRRNAGDYVKRWGAALIRGAATNAEFTVVLIQYTKPLSPNVRRRDMFGVNILGATLL